MPLALADLSQVSLVMIVGHDSGKDKYFLRNNLVIFYYGKQKILKQILNTFNKCYHLKLYFRMHKYFFWGGGRVELFYYHHLRHVIAEDKS